MKTQTKMHKKQLLVGSMLILLMFSSLLLVPTIANGDEDDDEETDPPEDDEDEEEIEQEEDEDGDGIDDDTEEENERELEIEVSNYEARIESYQEVGENSSEIEVAIEVPESEEDEDPGLKFELSYSTDNETTEVELEFEVNIQKIVEYVDLDGDGIFNSSNDEVIQEYYLDVFDPLTYYTETISGATVHVLEASTSDGVFIGRIYVIGEFTIINNSIVSPTEVKIDIEIHDFPYINDTSDLAMKVKLETESEIEHDEETEAEEDGRSTDEEEVEIQAGDYTGFFSWVEKATIDGVEKTVLSTPIEVEDGEKQLYLNYPRGTTIIHDPKIGVANILQSTDNTGNPLGINGFLLFSALGALAIIGLVSISRKKRKL